MILAYQYQFSRWKSNFGLKKEPEILAFWTFVFQNSFFWPLPWLDLLANLSKSGANVQAFKLYFSKLDSSQICREIFENILPAGIPLSAYMKKKWKCFTSLRRNGYLAPLDGDISVSKLCEINVKIWLSYCSFGEKLAIHISTGQKQFDFLMSRWSCFKNNQWYLLK